MVTANLLEKCRYENVILRAYQVAALERGFVISAGDL
jgi:hypothetical protein